MSEEESTQLVKQEQQLVLMPVMNVSLAKSRLAEFQAFIKGYLVEGEDFGIIPGTPKPTLLKPGADKLCEIYGLTDTYEITSRIEHWEKNLFDYEIRCTLSKRDGTKWAEGMGSCNSFEGKYRWRDSQRKCPICGKEAIIKGKAEYGGGWLCFAKKGGCGAKFKDGDKSIESQTVGRTENDDVATLKNTILKMAKKRAKVDATLAATRSSGIFTQDMEDISQNASNSRQDAPGSNDDHFVDGTVVEPTQTEPVKQTAKKAKKEVVAPPTQDNQFQNSYHFEIAKKQKIANEALLLPCFDHDRDKLYTRVNRTDHTLESITKAVTWIKDQAEIRAKMQKDIDKKNGLEITEKDLPLLNNIESATEVF